MIKNLPGLYGLVVLIIILGAIAVLFLNHNRERDNDVSGTRVRHRILANPIFWMYVLFPVAIVVGVYVFYYLL